MKKLVRIKGEGSMLGGVCTGLAEYFDVDVTLIRILFVMAVIAPIPAVIPYLVMWAIMPLKSSVTTLHT
ncbi:PspC domain-containing protein [Leadbetterella byssophila]|jgi:phage shock protein C|uniref:PspC domain protein n=1 Tax=Leadbetterella byssophila (strain DSM 17132 / JCM 16389 / KACC 11308 / NBRC 106382 / 4M15) TaxID=649349 RepID=E4RV80_LEAB4|nr:PspC domain-containing protein [Leadbetterella byssophila]ADQ18818.1 PspC domain protein [Leadbetterella byssophila DSM 17132]